jgi:hypothetical protein
MYKKNQPIYSYYFFIVSAIVIVYLWFFLLPYADKHGFFNENDSPDLRQMHIYLWLSAPIVISYILFVLVSLNKIKFLLSLNYPLLIFNIYAGIILVIISIGGAILWFVMPSVLIFILILPISLVYGLVRDIKYIRNNRTQIK